MSARPEIFISATSTDLKVCHQTVRDAPLSMGCVPVTQDHFSPGSGEVRTMLRRLIANCHAVIHIAGECYGYEPQQRGVSEPRRSYTQLKYDIARELKKPLYTFLCAPDFPYTAHEPEPEELNRLQNRHRGQPQGNHAAGKHLCAEGQDRGQRRVEHGLLYARQKAVAPDAKS